MADKKLTQVDESSTLLDSDKIIGNFGNSIKQVTVSVLASIIKDKITALKNPQPLSFVGAINESYDGATAKTINIPENSLLPTSGTANNGKILSVVNGSPAWVSLVNTEEVEY